MARRRRIFWLLAAMLAALVFAVSPAPAQEYRFRSFTSGTGLPSNAVYDMFQDRQGYVWFATDGGASRYDGEHYLNLSVANGLIDASVRGMVQDGAGTLWILTKGGLSRWDGTAFTHLTAADGLAHDEVRCGLLSQDGTLWFGTTAGLSHWDGTRFTNITPAEGLPRGPVWSLLEDGEGALWIGVRGGGLARFERGELRTFGPEQGLTDPNVFDLAADPSGGLWIATDQGLVHFDGQGFRNYTTRDGLPSNLVSSVLVDRHGRVWCGTFGGGVARLHDGRFTVFDRRNGLPDNYVTSLLKDRENNVWCGTLWNGAFRFGSERFANYTATMGVGSGFITGISEGGDGTLWLSSINDGLTAIRTDGSLRRYEVADGLIENGLWTVLADSRGRVWTGGLRGVSVLESGRFRRVPLAELGMPDRVNALAEDADGGIWFGSGAARSQGIVRWDGRHYEHYGVADGLSHDQVNSFTVDSTGRLWIATENGLTVWEHGRLRALDSSAGLPGKRVIHVHEESPGRMWVGTPDGLCLFDGQRCERVYREQNGLVNDFVHAITSREGEVWIGTARGISLFENGGFVNYTERDGLMSHEIASGAALRRSDGSVWFGTAAGAVRYRPYQETLLDLPPQLQLTPVVAGNERIPVGPPPALPHSRNTLRFGFVGLSFTDETAVRYRYRLDGFDTDWSPQTAERSVRFTNLPSGQYTFLVQARSAADLWSEPARYEFSILPAVWERLWFRGLLVAALVAIGWAAYRWRVRRLLRVHDERVDSLHRLLDSIRVINSRLDIETVLHDIAREAARLVDGEPGGIGLVGDGLVVFRRVWSGGAWQDRRVAVHVGEGPAGLAASTGQTRFTPTGGSASASPEARSALGAVDVPIRDRSSRVVGVLEVRAGSRPLGPRDAALLEALANQAAVAIEKAALYGALGEKNRQLAASVEELEGLHRRRT